MVTQCQYTGMALGMTFHNTLLALMKPPILSYRVRWLLMESCLYVSDDNILEGIFLCQQNLGMNIASFPVQLAWEWGQDERGKTSGCWVLPYLSNSTEYVRMRYLLACSCRLLLAGEGLRTPNFLFLRASRSEYVKRSSVTQSLDWNLKFTLSTVTSI